MVKLVKISKPQLQPLIEIAYKGDQELLDKYHIRPLDLMGATQSTMGMIEDMSKARNDLSYYKVLYGNKPIGYVVVFKDFLYSFGINIKFRVKKVLIGWWQGVLQILGNKFICGLYKNNTRAIEYLQRRGMEIVGESEHSVTLVKHSKCLLPQH